MAPRILLTATLRWPIAARLAMAFADIGCRVDVICPRQHPACCTDGVIERTFHYSAWKPLVSLREAITAAAPDLIIPCDDDAAVHLHQLYELTGDTDPASPTLRALIARSLGAPEAASLATARGRLMAVAAELGLLIPAEAAIESWDHLSGWLEEHGYPAVIKGDGTWGGQGVTIVHDRAGAQRAYERTSARPAVLHAIARMLLDRDASIFLRMLVGARRCVTVQKFVRGTAANRAVACWEGRVIAGTSVEAIRTQDPTGPATVVHVVDDAQMTDTVDRLVERLGVSGLWGMDFVVDAAGAAHLIEVNPRATPICHLPFGPGRNLPAALYTALAGEAPAALPSPIPGDVVAMFPGEWHRDPDSSELGTAYPDVPWDEPRLIADCLDIPWAERGLIARAWAAVRPESSKRRKRPIASLDVPRPCNKPAALRASHPSLLVGDPSAP
jgi:hypothetical protein